MPDQVPNDHLALKAIFEGNHNLALEERDAQWTSEEIRALSKILSLLPAAFVSKNPNLKTIVRERAYRGEFAGAPGHGMYQDNAGPDAKKDYIVLYDKAFRDETGQLNMGLLSKTLIHELSHSLDDENPGPFKEWLEMSGWFQIEGGKWLPKLETGFLNPYSRSHPKEDFAECFTAFVLQPDRLRIVAPQKYMFMERLFKEQ
jgi:hypothetical protein